MASLKASLASRNRTTVFAGILMASPACGLRPRRASVRGPVLFAPPTHSPGVLLQSRSISPIENGCREIHG